jgi:autoinducer 2-degrading protein
MVRIVIFTRLTARPGRRAELLAAFDDLHDAAQREDGTEVFVMHTARDDADAVLFYEVYRDQAALDRHRESPAVRALVARLGDLVAGPPQITYAEPARAKGIAG